MRKFFRLHPGPLKSIAPEPREAGLTQVKAILIASGYSVVHI